MKAEQVRRLALALDGAVELPHFHYTSFRAGGRIFATMAPDGTALHLFIGVEERDRAIAVYGAAIEPLHWGPRVVGVRVALAAAKPAMVEELLRQSYQHKANKVRPARSAGKR
jgi:hypothetical protein